MPEDNQYDCGLCMHKQMGVKESHSRGNRFFDIYPVTNPSYQKRKCSKCLFAIAIENLILVSKE